MKATATRHDSATPDGTLDAAEVAAWLLEGRFFTVGPEGAITSWSPAAAETFGWRRKEALGGAFAEKLGADITLSGYSGGVKATDASGRMLSAEFAFVPIALSVGYEVNSLLQDVTARSADADALIEYAKAHRDSVIELIGRASAGDDERPGSLVVFRIGAAPAPEVDNVVSIADAAGAEEARAQLDRARREAEEGRVEIRNLGGQLEEARREAQRARNEVDVARQEASDLRDELVVAQRGADEARKQLEDARRAVDEARAAAEEARIRVEESQREANSLREQLREARESVRGVAGRADVDLAEAQERQAAVERELAAAQAETARLEAEVAPLRGRYQAAQRDLGALRADVEAAQAALAEREAIGARRAGELERARAEVDALRQELEQARGEQAEPSPDETTALRGTLEQMRAAFRRSPVATATIAPDGGYIDVSESFCALLGHGREALLEADPPAIVHGDDAESHRDLVQRMLAGERDSATGFRRYVNADGRAMTLRESLALVRDGGGRATMFVVQLEESATDGHVVDAVVEPEEPSVALSGDAMRQALEDDMFELHCQPVLDLRTGGVGQHELLIRMRSEDGRLILPDAFLGPARRAGLAHAIDRWVVRRAVALLGSTEGVSLEVNLSPEAVHDPDLATVVEEELASSGVDPGRLVLEVTGGTAADALEETRDLAKRLRGLGCRFALDDFRSNFGSFRLLRDLPLDYLKLDGELVGSLTESRTSQLIVKALVDVAAGTGMKTIAVFVSDQETVELLRRIGVDYAQGYTVGRPRPVADVLARTTPQLPPG